MCAPVGCANQQTGLFIDNKFVKGSEKPITSINPATEETIADVESASAADVDTAVAAARRAFETTWGLNTPGVRRGLLMHKLADVRPLLVPCCLRRSGRDKLPDADNGISNSRPTWMTWPCSRASTSVSHTNGQRQTFWMLQPV
jgi:Aldehyde dehydrogenase family